MAAFDDGGCDGRGNCGGGGWVDGSGSADAVAADARRAPPNAALGVALLLDAVSPTPLDGPVLRTDGATSGGTADAGSSVGKPPTAIEFFYTYRNV
eukprot:1970170-Prymnesium_polylepis.1